MDPLALSMMHSMRQCLDVRVYTDGTSVPVVYVSRHLRPTELLTDHAVKEMHVSLQYQVLKYKKKNKGCERSENKNKTKK